MRRIHDLLAAAGPPPELPPELRVPAGERRTRTTGLPPRRGGAAIVLVLALVAGALGGGYALGHRPSGFRTASGPIAMRGPRGALATLRIGSPDAAGNRPLQLRVRGLPRLETGGAYALLLTRNGALGPSCGSFQVDGRLTEVTLNAPYSPSRWGGWAIVRRLPGRPESAPLLTS